MRAYGKGFEEFTQRAIDEYGIKYIRCKVPEVLVNEATDDLIVHYEDPEDNQMKSMELNLLVLSVGLIPSKTLASLQEILDLELDDYGYVKTSLTHPVETSVPGIFVCGTAQGPKDIPDSVAQASAAAAKAEVLISTARNQLIQPKKYPDEKPISMEPRVGVFICHCGINIGGVVNVPEVVEYAKTLPSVIHAERNLYTCSQDTQDRIKQVLEENDINRVVVASCTPRTHEPLFRNTLKETGLNPFLFQFCNIREHCSWVHMHEKTLATEKAKDLVRMAVSKARLLRPLKTQQVPVKKSALVIGGGISGMTASLDIANQGFQVHLVEKQAELGGFMRAIDSIQDGTLSHQVLNQIITQVQNHPLIRVHTETEIEEVKGFVGNFEAQIRSENNSEAIQFGTAIIAIGAQDFQPQGYYHFGVDSRVITQKQLEEKMGEGLDTKTVVMIQCVGSREEERPYCSRVCCTEAIKNAIRLKHLDPTTKVYIAYRDIRSYGLWESLYREARELGVIFLRYTDTNKPVVNSNLTVELWEPLLGVRLQIKPDLVVLSSTITPPADAESLSKMFKVPLDANGFFLEAHVKLRPVDFATEGVFVCGTAHSPKMIDESIAQASACASRACTILSKDHIESEGAISKVDDEKCKGCGLCVEACPFKAIELTPQDVTLETVMFQTRKATINPVTCKGCGCCAVACPVGAIVPEHFTREQIEAELLEAIAET